MSIRLECEHCGTRIKVPDGTEGRMVRCPQCGHTQRVAPSSVAVPSDNALAASTQAQDQPPEALPSSPPEPRLRLSKPTPLNPPAPSGKPVNPTTNEPSAALAAMAEGWQPTAASGDPAQRFYSGAEEQDAPIDAVEDSSSRLSDLRSTDPSASPAKPAAAPRPAAIKAPEPAKPPSPLVEPPSSYPPPPTPRMGVASPGGITAPRNPAPGIYSGRGGSGGSGAFRASGPGGGGASGGSVTSGGAVPVAEPNPRDIPPPRRPAVQAIPVTKSQPTAPPSPRPRATPVVSPRPAESPTVGQPVLLQEPLVPSPLHPKTHPPKHGEYTALMVLAWVLRLLAFFTLGGAVKLLLITTDLHWEISHRLLVFLAGLALAALLWGGGEVASAVRQIARHV